jgi:anhydro-N-acetylmuramic acid kinase
MLLDHWCQQHTGQPYDAQGAWAARGQVLPALLATLLLEPFFHAPPPKSTGRDLFSAAWLEERLHAYRAEHAPPAPEDVQATLAELTASACAESALRYGENSNLLAVCGGGAYNADLLKRLQRRLPQHAVQPTDALGLPAQQVEAAAFAWLARQALRAEPGNLQSVTGASGARGLGAIYPA